MDISINTYVKTLMNGDTNQMTFLENVYGEMKSLNLVKSTDELSTKYLGKIKFQTSSRSASGNHS